jgi:hypothetical protein
LPFDQAGLDHSLPILSFIPSLRWYICVTIPSFFFHWERVLQTFSLGPGWNHV